MAPGAPGLSGRLVEEASELESLQSSWDALAVAAGSPFAAPAWALAWWRHMAPDGARLAVVAVHRDDDLIGLAPFYASGRGVKQLRLLSGGWASRLGILARLGSEPEVAAAISATLADSDLRPDVIRWEAVDADSPWPGWLSDSWPDDRGHRLQDLSERSAPILHLGELPYEEWFGAKSRNFRSQMRRDRRAMEGQGATFRSTDRGSLGRDLEAFAGLHSSRWEGRGGSSAVNPGAMAALQEVGEALIEESRFRIWMIDGPDGEPVSAQVFVAAGGNVAYWNGGFDERWGKHHPGAVAILAAVEDAFERGDDLIDLGGGEARYKERLADEDRPVAWRTSYRRGLRYPLARLRQLPEQVARRGSGKLRERLGLERLNRLRGLLRR